MRNVLREVAKLGPSPGQRVALLASVLAATASGSRLAWELLPAVIWGWMAFAFARSLRDRETLAERLARVADPLAPDFIAPYCRGLTGVYAVVFAAIAAGFAFFALTGDRVAWLRFASWGCWLVLAALLAGEFLVRKLWFRNYTERAIDRLLARCFPAANTAMGRRCAAYVSRMRAEGARQRLAALRESRDSIG